MNRPTRPQQMFPIPDTQMARDDRRIAIDHVGIKGLKYPLNVVDLDAVAQPTVADCNVVVALPEEQKGTHMSRLVALLEAPGGRIEVAFPFFIRKLAPVSGVASLLDYQVKIAGELAGGEYTQLLTIAAPVTSLCPCSKEISEYGAHNQRSHVTVEARLGPDAGLDLPALIARVEAQASCELYGLLKRVDEKHVTERAYDNPKFVEDLVRDVAAAVREVPGLESFVVEGENFESIHNHSAYARIES